MQGQIEEPASYQSRVVRSVFISAVAAESRMVSSSISVGKVQRSVSSTLIGESSEALVKRLVGKGLEAPHFIRCDLWDIAALRAATTEAAKRNGKKCVLINNAGTDDCHTTESVTVEHWENRMQVRQNRTYSITARRKISELVLKYKKKLLLEAMRPSCLTGFVLTAPG